MIGIGTALVFTVLASPALAQTAPASQSGAEAPKAPPTGAREWRRPENFEEFGKAFQCVKGKPMYPEKSCRVW
jgi:hypothetical protein